MKKLICLLLLLTNVGALSAQRLTVSGWMTDSLTGEPLPGATVYDATLHQGAITDAYGFFSITGNTASRSLRFSYLGYTPDTFLLEPSRDTVLHVFLQPASLKEVLITADATPLSERVGVVNIPVEKLKSRPMLLGEADLMKALALTPGVRTGTEGSAGLYVRGGTPDQNYILLDGSTVYNSSHLFGFLSVFNPDAVKQVSLYKGHMPARFGGRLSSVIDVVMKEGNNQRHEAEISVGAISSKATFEGPIRKGRSSYMLSMRGAYLGLLALPLKIRFNNNKTDDYFNYQMYDLNGKVNFELSPKSRIYLSLYHGHDDWKALSRAQTQRYDFGLNWGNTTASVRYTNLLNNQFYYISQLSYNRYRFAIEQVFFDQTDAADKDFYFNRSYVEDLSFKNQLRWQPGSRHELQAGIELTRQSLLPQAVKYEGGNILEDSLQFAKALRFAGFSSAVFLEENYKIQPKIYLNIGVRGGLFNTGFKNYLFAEPRLAATWETGPHTVVQLSWRRNRQFLHLLATSSVGLPNEIWVPSTAQTPPSAGEQFSGGVSTKISRLNSTLSIEIYHKTMHNLLDYRQGANIIGSNGNWESVITKGGDGRAYGLECMLHRTTGRLNGWISYTLSRNERRFRDINGGNWYPHRYDRRHELAVTAGYSFNTKWSTAANFVFSTGDAFTAPAYYYIVDGNIVEPFYSGKNNERTPVYHRLDLSFTKKIKTRKGRSAYWAFGVYNTYAHNNPFYVDIHHEVLIAPDNIFTVKGFNVKYEVKSLFTFIPSINYGIRF